MADAQKAPKIRRRKIMRELRVKLTEPEVAERGRALADFETKLVRLEEEKKESAAEFKEKIDTVKDSIAGLVEEIEQGELRQVECYEVVKGGIVEIRRADTDEEVDTRSATLADRQFRLDDEIE